ncbi:hypothetical protein ABEG17_11830 [Pedococcus sp. KACC 23699]|uniref:Mce-associated membrane protein n=1 Tax=Pedococcus sp. KACC 23699 TaxID=3149228 RepID=A0AAU7JPD4_9MICO
MSSSADTPRPRPKVAGHRARARATPPGTVTAPVPPGTAPEVEPAARVERTAPPVEDVTPQAGGATATSATTAAGGATATTAIGAGEAPVGRRRWIVPAVALVASLALLGTVGGISLQDQGADARTGRVAANQARTSIEQMLSYNYKTIDAQSAQIEGLLTGSFKTEFSTAMDKQIKPLAVKNQTVVQARVSDVGVMSASPTTVKVLAFVNQARVGADQKSPVVDQNRVLATLSKVGDRWLISRVDAF